MTPATNRQVPDNSIMDIFGKQTYLGNTFAGSSGLVAQTTAEATLLSIACPAQNTASFQNAKALFVRIKNLLCNDVTQATGIVFRVYLNATTVAAGTPFTPVQLRPANTNASLAVVKISPTVATKGTLLATYAVGFQSPLAGSDLIILDASQNLLITAQASAASFAGVNLEWNEF